MALKPMETDMGTTVMALSIRRCQRRQHLGDVLVERGVIPAEMSARSTELLAVWCQSLAVPSFVEGQHPRRERHGLQAETCRLDWWRE